MTVDRTERHSRGNPCEVCGGHDGLPRGKEVRCNGYTSADGKWCFCSRIAEGAHHEVQTVAGTLYVHLLRDEPMENDDVPHFTRNGQVNEGAIAAAYDYTDGNGELVYQVVRLEPKSFRQRRPNGDAWIWSIAGIPRQMYRARALAESEGLVFLCEGEKDADAVAALGLQSTTSSGGAQGVKQSVEAGRAALRGRDVAIVPDSDERGAQYAKDWATTLDGYAKSVRICNLKHAKDPAAWIESGATAADFFALWDKSSPEEGPIRWVTLADMAKPLPPVDWLCEPLKLARGPVSCLAGYGYSGKTAIAQALLLCLATGKSLFGLFRCPQIPVGWMDYEQGWRMSAGRMQRQARGMGIDLSLYPSNALRYAEFPGVYLDEKGSNLDAIARATDGMGLCLMDSAKAMTPGIDENDSRIRVPFDALSRVTQKNGCQFLIILHYGKSGEDGKQKPLKERMRGSSALFDAMQTVWGLEAKEKDTFTRCELAKDRVTNVRELTFGVRFEDDPAADAVRLIHLEKEQLSSPTKAALFKANVLHTIKANPALTSVEDVRFYMADGYRNLNEVRSAIRELQKSNQIVTVNGAYRAV